MKRLWLILVLALLVSGTARAEVFVSKESEEPYVSVDWEVNGQDCTKQEWTDNTTALFQADREKFQGIMERGKQYLDESGNLGYEMPDGTLVGFCNPEGTGTVSAGSFLGRVTEQQDGVLSHASTLPDTPLTERGEMGQTLSEHEEAMRIYKALKGR